MIRTDLRCRHGEDVKLSAVELMEHGFGEKAIASRLAIHKDTARQWIRTYKAIGLDGLLNMGSKHKVYDYETKLAAVRDFFDNGLTKSEVMAKYAIASASPFESWCRKYRAEGAEALLPKPKGRPRCSGKPALPKTYEEQLEERIRKLETENAYLKKVRALKAEKSQTAKSRRS